MKKNVLLLGVVLSLGLTAMAQTSIELVKDINPTGNGSPNNFIEMGGKMYFSADDGNTGRELWISDGTSAGTQLLKDINPSGDSYPYGFVKVGGKIYFSADNGTNGTEIWATDGTSTGTQLIKDINPSNASSNPSNFFALNNKIYFT